MKILIFFTIMFGVSFISFKKNYIKSNQKFDTNKTLKKAKIVSYNNDVDTNGWSADVTDNPISMSTDIKGKRVGSSNSAMVEIIDTGEIVNCKFGKIVNDEKYPIGTIIEVYYFKEMDKYDVRSKDYPELFKKSRNISK